MNGNIPWWAKVTAKIVLSRLPAGYALWKRLRLFEHGFMDRPEYAFGVVTRHLEKSGFQHGKSGFVALEIGPGDSLFSGLIAHAFGASRTYLIDAGPFAAMRIEGYRAMERYLAARGFPLPETGAARLVDDLLEAYGIRYLTQGVGSLAEIPDASVDFIWSHATLEHVRRRQFPVLAREMRRVLRPQGIGSHQVDLRDHLGGALNNLRFSEQIWESEFMARSGFYTNRIGHAEMLEAFRSAGFDAEALTVNRWDRLPTPQQKMAREFRARSLEDLQVSGFHILLRPV